MLTSLSGAVSTGVILVSTVYIAVRTPAIWHRYKGQYGRLLVGVPLVGLLFGLAHLGMLTPLSHGLLATIETGAILGVAAVIGGLGYIHPRLGYSGGELR
ncbi:hypothetical protein [Halorubrum salsamenti]|jgi:hypothetical protein|uniref:hypothetical protein n=1 Tax=Halorubrum salsamenti TaxID=2583990 RepID=UPI0011A9EFAD|nr:hypothetical protein [Halorubrum salsamenti]